MSARKKKNVYRTTMRLYPGDGSKPYKFTCFVLSPSVQDICDSADRIVRDAERGVRQIDIIEVTLISEEGFVA